MLRSYGLVGLIVLGITSLGWGQDSKKTVVFIAGGPSHGYGSHEHYAGCRLLADTIQKANPDIRCEVLRNGWPQDDSILDSAQSIVIYADGGGGHPANKHLDRLEPLMKKGVGLVCIHYGVEVPKGDIGNKFLEWLGGYFETHWSVNPHWTAKYESLPNHPIARGVKPFEANDEWYFHMRFRPEMKGVTPILSAIAPASTMERPDGPHSGNPDVRRAVAKQEPQHTAWAFERQDGGRSFGFTGGHYHWNWGHPSILKLVSNAIVWTTHTDVPPDGLAAPSLGLERLQENQDEKVPDNFNAKGIIDSFKIRSQGPATKDEARQPEPTGRQLYASPILKGSTKRVDAVANIRGVKRLFLVVQDGGDGFSCDWADWIRPTLHGTGGKQKPLTDLEWKKASSDWGQVHKNRNVEGQAMRVAGQGIDQGIGTHANSVVEFELPEGFDELRFGCGLDEGGTSQNDGNTTSVQFFLFADGVPRTIQRAGSNVNEEQRKPENAVGGLTLYPGLEAKLAASEPQLKSLTNLDIDDRGRVWVCEVVNYRRHNGERPEGDRILILEDTNQDGVMDTSKVFYQGRDIDSAMGIMVLGNRVFVSAAPYVWMFTDADGDDVPEKKEGILSQTGQPQHDHSNHSFVFGPDGKLYWNFGNTGKAMFDGQGKPIVDRWGRPINDSGKPYRQGMAFRCNPDLSDMEVLGHNFRNNYELAVDSYGTVWQSDNDDDGNRATRINYVMEFGNFGYTDEFTGEGWQAERVGWESEIPLRHWHLNDPGVVPTMLITGAGSPTGITVYEGRMLPEVFWDQVIHCDAGPNVVRAYPVKKNGAGYSAEIANLITGERDNWFRPADVCVAPDGSLYVTDWYDPGVGGHNMVDMERGRLFRVAPPNTPYKVSKFDYSTPQGAIEALRNPANAVRAKAWMALHGMGEKAKAALEKLSADANPRLRARALWLLGRMPQSGMQSVQQAMRDSDPNIRITAIRLARMLRMPTADYVSKMSSDSDMGVLRELAIALREDTSKDHPTLWAKLAQRYDGKDRWYLEALGIAAMDRWSECIAAWMQEFPAAKSTPAGMEILWRARCSTAAQVIADRLLVTVDESEFNHLLRGLDFQSTQDKQTVWERLAKESKAKDGAAAERIAIEAAVRLGTDIEKDDKLKAIVKTYLGRLGKDPKQLRLIRQLKLQGYDEHLLQLIQSWGPGNDSVQALDIILNQGDRSLILAKLKGDVATPEMGALSKTLALSNGKNIAKALEDLLIHEQVPSQVKIDASLGLARNPAGQKRLIEMAKSGKLPGEAKVLVGPLLLQSRDEGVRKESVGLFPPKKTKQASLPPINELVSRKGNIEKGKTLFDGIATCSQCHIVNNQGKNVGPDLSEIGTKLSKEAMYVSILEPSAGISHNYEAWIALLDDGEVITGLMITQSGESVTLRDAKGIDRVLKRSDIETLKKSEKSLMPENLQETMNEEGLVDLVEYLMSLRKKS